MPLFPLLATTPSNAPAVATPWSSSNSITDGEKSLWKNYTKKPAESSEPLILNNFPLHSFLRLCYHCLKTGVLLMAKDPILLRRKYIQNPPEGFTADEIRKMSYEDLLDMDYFLNEDDIFDFDDDEFEDGFFIF